MDKIKDRDTKIQSTLLEYGQQNILLGNLTNQSQAQSSKQTKQDETKVVTRSEEEESIKKLIDEMTETDQKQNKINANAVGQILGLQQSTLQQIVTDFSNKVKNILSFIFANKRIRFELS